MPAATLTEKGQIVIPAEIRERYQLTPGTQVEFVSEGGTIRSRRPEEGGPIRSGVRLRHDQGPAEARAQGRAPAFAVRPRGDRGPPPEAGMIALDTNLLARFYCDDPEDPEAGRQWPIALSRVVLGWRAAADPVRWFPR